MDFVSSGTTLGDPVWQKIGNQGDKWMYGQVYLGDLGTRKLVFEAAVGKSYYSDTALDDIFVNDGSCPHTGRSLCYSNDVV